MSKLDTVSTKQSNAILPLKDEAIVADYLVDLIENQTRGVY